MNHAMNSLEHLAAFFSEDPMLRSINDVFGCRALEIEVDTTARKSFRIPGKPASDTFFVILEPCAGPSTVVFNDHEEAVTEAKRLARDNPGRTFYILKTVQAVTSEERPVAVRAV